MIIQAQDRSTSYLEAILNYASVFILGMLVQIFILPLAPLSIYIPLDIMLCISVSFSLISLLCSYTWRRLFNMYAVIWMRGGKYTGYED